MEKFVTGDMWRDMIISGAHLIDNRKQAINDLNVFPVPDGDTGINMALTIGAAAKALAGAKNKTVGEISALCASAVLKGARGNSGVILSILFRGIGKGLKEKETANGRDFAQAYQQGVEAAYKAVMKPSEGTILTVARVSAEKAMEDSETEDDFLTIFKLIMQVGEETLQKTPEMLPVLKQANVVDAGGKGLLVIFEGMLSVLEKGEIIPLEESQDEPAQKADFSFFNTEDITYMYCTEFIVNKDKKAKMQDSSKLRSYLETMGDSIVVAEDDDIIKVHVHTDHPGKALEEALTYGLLCNLKIENMREQHEEQIQKQEAPQHAEPEKEYGFVAVASGDGVCAAFRDLGVDVMVQGGQTMNPSTEDILAAVYQTPAKTVFVLPNNKNIIMAAEMAVPLCEDRKIVVIPTKTIPQGVACLFSFNSEEELDVNAEAMTESMAAVKTGQVTFAVRDSEIDGRKIRKGEMLGLLESKVSYVERSKEKAVMRLLANMVDESSSFLTVFYGRDVTDRDAASIKATIQRKYGKQVELNMVNGGQPVYYYIISVE